MPGRVASLYRHAFSFLLPWSSFAPFPPLHVFLSESLPWVWVSHGLSWRTSFILCPSLSRCHVTRYDGRGGRGSERSNRINEDRRRCLYFCSTAKSMLYAWMRCLVIFVLWNWTDRIGRSFVQVSYTILLTPFLFCFGKILGDESSWGTVAPIYRVRSCSFALMRRYPFDSIVDADGGKDSVQPMVICISTQLAF